MMEDLNIILSLDLKRHRYLAPAKAGKFYEGDIFEDELNREKVKKFDEEFMSCVLKRT